MTGVKIVVPHPSEQLPEDVYGSWSGSPSPDGTRIVFVSDRGGAPEVWLRDLDREGWAKVHTGLERVTQVCWSPDGRWLLCVVAARGSSRSEAWAVPFDGGAARLLAGAPGVNVGLGDGACPGWSTDSRAMLTEVSGARAVGFLCDPADGSREEVVRGELLTLADVSGDGGTALLRVGPRGQRRLEVLDRSSGTRTVLDLGPGPGATAEGSLSADGTTAYAITTVGHDLGALVRLSGDGVEVLAERPDAELESAVPSRDGTHMALLWNVRGGTSAVSVLDLASGSDSELALPRDVVGSVGFVPDGTALVVTAESWSDTKGVWVLETSGLGATPVSHDGGHVLLASPAATTLEVDTEDLVPPSLHRFASSDGIEVSGWLYRPASAGPWPSVIWLHGGPESQERPVYNSLFQSLVADGIAVLALNVRGSTGFGHSFSHLDDLGGRYAAIEDVACAARYLVAAGVSEAQAVGVAGRSYGGYLTLAALVRHPDLFAAGVDVCGMSDFATFYEHTEPYIAATAVSKYGDPVADSALLADLSPLRRIEALRAPLLIVHGAQDTNVPLIEAQQVAAALQARGIPHRFVQFEGEGHELLATANRVRFVQETVDWLCRHLGE